MGKRKIFIKTDLTTPQVDHERDIKSEVVIGSAIPPIRLAQGRDSRAQRDAKRLELQTERDKTRELRQEIASLRSDVSRIASINEVLLAENAVLRARLGDPHVVPIHERS